MRKRLIAVMLVALLCMGMSMTAYAVPQITPEEQPPAEATEEEAQAFKAEQLKKYYDMPVATNEIKGWTQGPGTYGEAAIIMEAGTGEILYGKNIDDQHYPASITKVLTALVALENGNLDDKVIFTHDCVSFLQPGDSSIGMKENDEITLEQALYATLLASANEAAYAVAENVGKNAGHDYQWFIFQNLSHVFRSLLPIHVNPFKIIERVIKKIGSIRVIISPVCSKYDTDKLHASIICHSNKCRQCIRCITGLSTYRILIIFRT